MARKNKEAAAEATEETTSEKNPESRRRQSPRTRLSFALNNLINACEKNGWQSSEVDAAKNLLEDLAFERRESTVVVAQKISAAIQSLDIMDDLTPMRTKKLGQLLGKAQRGVAVSDEDINEAAGMDIEFVTEEDGDEAEASSEAEASE